MKKDIYGHELKYNRWKEHVLKNGEDDLTKKNSKIFLQFIFDMEVGANVGTGSKKGPRTPHRLNALRQKLSKVLRMLQERNVKDITNVKREVITELFADMRNGKILSDRGTPYKSTSDYVKEFKAFWHWWMKINRLKKDPIILSDITEDISSQVESKPKWVYLGEKKMQKLLKKTKHRYAVFFDFMYCSGARVTEAFSLQGKDITQKQGIVYCNISEEISKTIGRKIKLQMCGENLIKYIKENKIKDEDYLFPFNPVVVNRYTKELSKELFGEGITEAGKKYSEFTLYDFRHNSSCFWLPRYKTNSAMTYRFGWKSEKFIHYYSEFLGMKDSIRDEDMYVDVTKTELQKKLENVEKQVQFLMEEREMINKNIPDVSYEIISKHPDKTFRKVMQESHKRIHGK